MQINRDGREAITKNSTIEALLKANSYDLGPKVNRIEDPAEWTAEKIRERAAAIDSDKGPAGNFDD
jgi:fructose-bisphosphate aldolase class II